jgi:hypothetical protein
MPQAQRQRPFSTYPQDTAGLNGGIIQEASNQRVDLASNPCDLGSTDESIERAIEEPLLHRQNPIIDMDIQLPTHVKLLHWVLLAQGSRWPLLQLVITYGLGAGWIGSFAVFQILEWYADQQNTFDLLIATSNFIFGLEAIVNAFFCYRFCQHKQLQHLVIWATAEQRKTAASPLASLEKVAWGGWAALLLLVGLATWDTVVGMKSYPMWYNIPQILLIPLMYGLMFYLCLVWLWTNWVLHNVAQNWVQHRLDADSVLGIRDRDAGKELWEILTHMKEVSSTWAINHAVRLITTTSVATTMLMLVERELQGAVSGPHYPHLPTFDMATVEKETYQLTIAGSLYFLVWVTAAVPGYITDMLFSNLQRKLYTMWPEPDMDSLTPPASVLPVQPPQRPQPLTPVEAKATWLMHRAHYLQGREGMHFAFVPMSLARAITVGTVLGYTIAFTTRISK